MDVPQPNHLHFDNGEQRFSSPFGHYHSAYVINADRPGHTPYVKVSFTYGLCAEFSRGDTVQLVNELQQRLDGWPEPRTPGQP